MTEVESKIADACDKNEKDLRKKRAETGIKQIQKYGIYGKKRGIQETNQTEDMGIFLRITAHKRKLETSVG
ncbi:hypothetical protein LEP1GSC086_2108 [Leptospira weilii str. LNT 1234]|nr:hypothetical protein LEP1GSC086_2108 [Leptospira weilii str. LNT 1234]